MPIHVRSCKITSKRVKPCQFQRHHVTPYKLIHAIVMIPLQESMRQSYKHFEAESFPHDARFNVWAISTRFRRPTQIGVVVLPVMEVKASELQKHFNRDPAVDQGILTEYYKSMKGQEETIPCRMKWTMSSDNCNQLNIRRDAGEGDGNEYTRSNNYFTG